ncbi:MAG: SPFH domain-containing protein [Candidatus Dormibacteria bacterium]
MPLFGEVRREFIARPDAAKNQILYKWPDMNIRKFTQLTVEQDELAVFFRDGRVQGTIPPGRVTLDSSEIPFLGLLVDAASGGNLFRTELYFVSTHEFPTLPFGGAVDNVVDPETGLAIGLGVFGDYSLKIVEPQSLIVNLVGTQNLTSNDEITNWIRDQLLKVLRTDVVAKIVNDKWPILGIAAHTTEIEQTVLTNAQNYVNTYGVQIVRLGNFTISIKPEDEETLKKYRKDIQYTKLAGGFQQYSVGEALQGIGTGASQGGGGEASPAILGLGLGLGGMAYGAGNQAVQQGAAGVQVRCPKCNALNLENARFCASCGAELGAVAAAPPAAAAMIECPKCHAENVQGAKFCSNCGETLAAPAPPPAPAPPAAPATAACPQCGTQNPVDAKFCSNCGHQFGAPEQPQQ